MEYQQKGLLDIPELESVSDKDSLQEIDCLSQEKKKTQSMGQGKSQSKDSSLHKKENSIIQELLIDNKEMNDIEDNPQVAIQDSEQQLQNEQDKPEEKKKRKQTKRKQKTETQSSEDLQKKDIPNEGNQDESFLKKFCFKENPMEGIQSIQSQSIAEQPSQLHEQEKKKRGRKEQINTEESENNDKKMTDLIAQSQIIQSRNENKESHLQQNKKKDHVTIQYDKKQEIFASEEDEYLWKCKRIFPYEQPYDSQVESMKQILKSLIGHKNLLFQSPTGTGKTLMTICSALTYIEKKKDTQILLLTRTNEQVNGLIKEIRKIKGYEEINQYAILAGRGQFCLKLDEFKSEQKNQTSEDDNTVKDSTMQLNQFCKSQQKSYSDWIAKQNPQRQYIPVQKEETKIENENENNDDDSSQTVVLESLTEIAEDLENDDDPYKNNPLGVFKNHRKIEIDLTEDENLSDPIKYKSMCQYKSIHDTFAESIKPNSSLRMPYLKSSKHEEYTLPDIEDLKDLFKHKELGCPYYYNKLAINSAKIVFATYNYVIKQKILKLIKRYFKKKNLIVIFDEGHNISDQAEQESAMELRKDIWNSFYQTLSKSQEMFSRNKSITSDNLSIRKLVRENLNSECQEIKKKIEDSFEKQEGRHIILEDKDKHFSQDLNSEEFQNKKRENTLQQFKKDDSDSSDSSDLGSESEEVYNFNENQNLLPENQDNLLNNIKEEENLKTDEMINDFQNNFKVKSVKMYNLYDQIKMVISKEIRPHMIYHPIIQSLKEILTQVQNQRQKYSVSSLLENLKFDQLLQQYKQERNKEIISFLDNFQSDFLIIREYCEHLIEYFDEENSQNKELFCKLFIDNTLNPHLQKLNILDSDETSQFLETIQKTYHMLKYIKKVIEEQTSLDLEDKKQKKAKGLSNILVVGDSDSPYKAGTAIVEESVTNFARDIYLKSFSKIWCFYSKLHNMRRLQISQENPTYLQDHYFAIMKVQNQNTKVPYLQIGCLSAKYLFENIRKKLKIQSLIFSSGTLEPFELMEQSIGIEFEKYSSPHVINPQTNLFTQFIYSFNKQTISFSFQQQQIEKISEAAIQALQEIMNLFLNHSKKTNKKAGVIVFFKNYSLMDKYCKTIQTMFKKDFKVYKEPKDASQFKKNFSLYKNNIENNMKNCIFLAVNRGKLSEGIDLKDELCRTVILFGVPYPSLYDPYIECKQKHAKKFMNEQYWYEKVTVKVLNQSAGRCIRYKEDWGGIFFIDEQFKKNNIKSNISQWILAGQKGIEEDKDWLSYYEEFLNNKIDS